MTLSPRLRRVALVLAALVLLTSCTRRQLVPGIIAGTGAILTTSGAIYRASLETDEPFGETSGEVATTAVLIFGGIGLLLTGIIWSLTSTRCDSNDDCWSGDACELRSHTCIDGDAARRLNRGTSASNPAEEEDGDEDEGDSEGDDSDESESESDEDDAETAEDDSSDD